MASLHPTDGARIVLERDTVEDGGARYRVAVYEPEARRTEGRAALLEEVALEWEGDAPPDWVEAFLMRFLKSLRKKHLAEGDWPRKITRWRAGAARAD